MPTLYPNKFQKVSSTKFSSFLNFLKWFSVSFCTYCTAYFQDYLRTTILFDRNPIVLKANNSMLREIIYRYSGANLTRSTGTELLEIMNNFTSDKNLFEPALSLGHHSQSPLCININTAGGDISLLEIGDIVLISIIITIVSLSYIVIALTTKRTGQGVGDLEVHKEQMKFLSLKVCTCMTYVVRPFF